MPNPDAVLLFCLWAISWSYTSPSLILLRSATLDTEHERLDERRRALFADDTAVQAGAPAVYLLHFDKVTTAARGAVLASSSLILGYVPHNTLLVSSEAPAAALRAIDGVTWSMPLLPAHKVDPQLLELLDETGADAAALHSVVVQVVNLVGPRTWQPRLQHQGCVCATRSFGASTILLECSTANHARCACDWISRQPETIWLEAKAEYAVLNKYAVPLVLHGASDGLQASRRNPFREAGIEGQNEIIGLADTGIDVDSCYFWDPSQPIAFNQDFNFDHRKIVNYRAFADGSDAAHGHGTHVAASLAGEALSSRADVLDQMAYDGVAPKAKLAFTDIGFAGAESILIPDNFTEFLAWTYHSGARIHANAWGNGMNIYNSQTAELDLFVSNHEDFLVVFAGGNEGDKGAGTIGAPATCKNCISVGASHNDKSAFAAAGVGLILEVRGLSTALDTMSFLMHPALYGPSAHETSWLEIVPVLPSSDGCSDWNFDSGLLARPLEGKIALARRGACLFVEKSKRAQALGAVAVIITNNENAPMPPLQVTLEYLARKKHKLPIVSKGGRPCGPALAAD